MLTLLAPLILTQTFTIDHVTTTPGLKDSAVRSVVESSLPELEKCKSPYPLRNGDQTDDRIIITFTTPGRRLEARGEIDTDCAEAVARSWRFPVDDVRIEVWLRAKFDFAASRRQVELIEAHLKFTCAAFIKRLGKKAPTDSGAMFDAVKDTQVDLIKRAFPAGKAPEGGAPYIGSLTECSPADFGVLLNGAFEDLHLAPDESCKKVLGWFRNAWK